MQVQVGRGVVREIPNGPPGRWPILGARWWRGTLLDLLQHAAVQHQTLIPYSLLVVLPVVSRAVFLSVGPSLIAVGFGLSSQLFSRGISFRHDGWRRRPWEEGGEGGEEAGKYV
jgi:hypothetical protein